MCMRKHKLTVLLVLLWIASIATTVYLCDQIALNRSLQARKADLSLYFMLEDYDHLVNSMGNIMSEDDFEKIVATTQNGALLSSVSIHRLDNGSVMVIEYYQRSVLLRGYEIKSVRVFAPGEEDELLKYLSMEK